MSVKDFDFKKEVTEKKTYERIRPIGAFVNKCNFDTDFSFPCSWLPQK